MEKGWNRSASPGGVSGGTGARWSAPGGGPTSGTRNRDLGGMEGQMSRATEAARIPGG